MRRVVFFIILFTLATLSHSFGQNLKRAQSKGKWGFVTQAGKSVIPLKYDDAKDFSNGLAPVKLYNKWGFIDNTGKEVIPIKYNVVELLFDARFSKGLLIAVQLDNKWGCIDEFGEIVVPINYNSRAEAWNKRGNYLKQFSEKKFSDFAKEYVEEKINEWQKKGEFEKTVDWQKRVNETIRKEKITQLTKEAEIKFIERNIRNLNQTMFLSDYDADNEVYLIKSDMFGNLLIPVPFPEAKDFKANWNNIGKKNQKYFIENDKLGLAEMTFTTSKGKSYKYSNQASLNYSVANIDYNFEPIDINLADNSSGQKSNQNISTINLNVGKSDVAINIPITNIKNDKTFAVIIANENYRRESQVIFAKSDGAVFKEYCIKTLGLPEKNIHYVVDGTLNDIRSEIKWLSSVANAYHNDATIIFYYAGHGIPDESSKTSYLLPIDGYGSDVSTGYKLDGLYQELGLLPVKNITIFLDACFSGAQRSGEMLASARGVAIKTQQGKPTGNMVVFSAAQEDETAYPYREKGHGLFTYFLLKKLQETKGNVTLGELGNYITTNVKQKSIVENRKSQTPTVIPSASLMDWQSLKLK